MRGPGTTTLGRALAPRLELRCADTGRALVERTGAPAAAIPEAGGADGLGRRQSAVLAARAQGDDRVVASGGGAGLSAANRELMGAGGTVVYLRARLEHLWERTRHDTSRPLLATADPRATLAALLE